MWGQVLKCTVFTSSRFTVYHGLTFLFFGQHLFPANGLEAGWGWYQPEFVCVCLTHACASWPFAGVVHRDIKPENFMYGRGGKAHIGFCCFHLFSMSSAGMRVWKCGSYPVRVSSFFPFHQIHHLHLIDFGLSDTYWGRPTHWSLRVVEPGFLQLQFSWARPHSPIHFCLTADCGSRSELRPRQATCKPEQWKQHGGNCTLLLREHAQGHQPDTSRWLGGRIFGQKGHSLTLFYRHLSFCSLAFIS